MQILIIFLLVFFNAFFSLAEVALISARKNRLELKAEKGNRSAKVALRLQNDPDLFLSTAQIGITIVSILTGIYTSAEISDSLAVQIESLGMEHATALMIAQTTILILATYLQCELGELFPKRLGLDMADTMACLCAQPMMFFARMMKPFVWFLTKSTELLVLLFHLQKEDKRVTEEEIRSVIREGKASGEVDEVEQTIMERTLALGDRSISSLMTYRTDVVTLDVNMSVLAIEDVIRNTPYAYYPVVEGDLDNVLGVISLKGLIMRLTQPDFSLRQGLKAPMFLPENISVYKALEHLKQSQGHIALICDEYGSVSGLLTFRDILEGLVGNITEDEEEPEIIPRKDGVSWVIYGGCNIFDFLHYFHEDEISSSEFNTVAGLLLVLLDRIPKVGDECIWRKWRFRVLEMDGHRVEKILLLPLQPTTPSKTKENAKK